MDAANPDESLRTPELLLVEMFPPAPSKIVVTEEEMVELEIIPPPQPDELPGWVWAVMFTAIFLIFTAVGSYFFWQWWSNKKSNPSQSLAEELAETAQVAGASPRKQQELFRTEFSTSQFSSHDGYPEHEGREESRLENSNRGSNMI